VSAAVIADMVSFDGGTRLRQGLLRPDRYRDLEALPADQPRIVKGGGYSYAAAGFGGGGLVQDSRAFNRILAFDRESGLLDCEAGTPLGRIFELAAPLGWFLPVQPGYPRITVGGCIAADVHGKNQFRDGTFRRVVRSLELFHPRHGTVRLGCDEADGAFELTCGGLGLTGQILSARLQLARLVGSAVRVARRRIDRFEDTLPMLTEQAGRADLLYTWHTFTARGEGFGRGFVYEGRFIPGSPRDDPRPRPVVPIDAHTRRRLGLQLLNRATTGVFNGAYEVWQSVQPQEHETDLFSCLFPVARKVLYFALFGRRGFHEYQMIVPSGAFGDLARALKTYFARNRIPVTLASCKLFDGSTRYLRFDGAGLCLALDFPRGATGTRFAVFLDGLVRELRGVPNVVKDSRLPRDVVAACFPGYEPFREALRAYDPARIYRSEVSERLDL